MRTEFSRFYKKNYPACRLAVCKKFKQTQQGLVKPDETEGSPFQVFVIFLQQTGGSKSPKGVPFYSMTLFQNSHFLSEITFSQYIPTDNLF